MGKAMKIFRRWDEEGKRWKVKCAKRRGGWEEKVMWRNLECKWKEREKLKVEY